MFFYLTFFLIGAMIVSERLCFVVKVLFKDVEVQKLLDDYQKN